MLFVDDVCMKYFLILVSMFLVGCGGIMEGPRTTDIKVINLSNYEMNVVGYFQDDKGEKNRIEVFEKADEIVGQRFEFIEDGGFKNYYKYDLGEVYESHDNGGWGGCAFFVIPPLGCWPNYWFWDYNKLFLVINFKDQYGNICRTVVSDSNRSDIKISSGDVSKIDRKKWQDDIFERKVEIVISDDFKCLDRGG